MRIIRRPQRDERGMTLVFLAISMVALMAFAGLAIDGGRAFAGRRQVQNGADAAAIAGTNTLNAYLVNSSTTPASQIWTTVQSVATSNGINVTSCILVDSSGAPADSSAACSTYTGNTLPASAATAAGVEVIGSQTITSAFMQFVGVKKVTPSGTAIATVQAATITSGAAPWLICAVDDVRDGGTPQVTTGGLPIPILLVNDTVNPLSIGQNYPLKGVDVKKECGTNGSFKGLVDGFDNSPPTQYPVPGYWNATTGNHSGPNRVSVAGSCGGEVVGCDVLLPLCYPSSYGAGNNPNSFNFYCVALGAFQLTAVSANADYGNFLGTNFTSTGGAGGGLPAANQPRVINLIK